MPKIWRNRIIGETKTFAQCPDRYKDEVLELLRQDVVDGTMTASGVMTAEKFKEYTGIDYEVAE